MRYGTVFALEGIPYTASFLRRMTEYWHSVKVTECFLYLGDLFPFEISALMPHPLTYQDVVIHEFTRLCGKLSIKIIPGIPGNESLYFRDQLLTALGNEYVSRAGLSVNLLRKIYSEMIDSVLAFFPECDVFYADSVRDKWETVLMEEAGAALDENGFEFLHFSDAGNKVCMQSITRNNGEIFWNRVTPPDVFSQEETVQLYYPVGWREAAFESEKIFHTALCFDMHESDLDPFLRRTNIILAKIQKLEREIVFGLKNKSGFVDPDRLHTEAETTEAELQASAELSVQCLEKAGADIERKWLSSWMNSKLELCRLHISEVRKLLGFLKP